MVRMLGWAAKSRRHRIGRAHRKNVHDTPTLQVDEDRAKVVLALLPRPIVDPEDVYRLVGGGCRCAAFDHAENGVRVNGEEVG